MNQNSKPHLSFTAFMDWVDGWRARHGLRPLADDEYDELYARFSSAKIRTLDLIDQIELIEARMAEERPTKMSPEEREATHAQLRRLPPARQKAIREMVRIIVERHRLNQRIADGSATQN